METMRTEEDQEDTPVSVRVDSLKEDSQNRQLLLGLKVDSVVLELINIDRLLLLNQKIMSEQTLKKQAKVADNCNPFTKKRLSAQSSCNIVSAVVLGKAMDSPKQKMSFNGTEFGKSLKVNDDYKSRDAC